uniref:Putative secreted protein n=1 Tax=Rhipicephalus microplus TaxID=6941 RepID=A0A6M2DAH5_RHIMP
MSTSQCFNIIYRLPQVHCILLSITLNTTLEYLEHVHQFKQGRLKSCKVPFNPLHCRQKCSAHTFTECCQNFLAKALRVLNTFTNIIHTQCKQHLLENKTIP